MLLPLACIPKSRPCKMQGWIQDTTVTRCSPKSSWTNTSYQQQTFPPDTGTQDELFLSYSSTLMTKCSFCSPTDEAAEISQQNKPSCTTIKVIKAEVLPLHWGNLQLRKPPGIREPTSSIPGTPTWEENSINKVTYEEIMCSCFLLWDTNVQSLWFQNTLREQKRRGKQMCFRAGTIKL